MSDLYRFFFYIELFALYFNLLFWVLNYIDIEEKKS